MSTAVLTITETGTKLECAGASEEVFRLAWIALEAIRVARAKDHEWERACSTVEGESWVVG